MFGRETLKRLGGLGVFSTLMMLVSPLVVVLNWLSYGITALWALEATGIIPLKIISMITFPFWTAVPAAFNVMYLGIWLKGAVLEGISIKGLHTTLPQMIWYMNVLMPIAASRALYQEIFKAVVWEKTVHEGRGVAWGIVKA
jgi:hypothetical protein